MPPNSFNFRLALYERYHWTPDVVLALPLGEAELLSVWLEEQALRDAERAYEGEQQRRAQRAATTANGAARISDNSGPGAWTTDLEFSEEPADEAEE